MGKTRSLPPVVIDTALPTMNSLSLVLRLFWLTALVTSANAGLVISEVMARGGHDFADDDGDHPDWLEIFNNGSEDIALGKYALTDDEEDLLKWKLPARTLPAGTFVTVFASGKDRRPEEGALHANFELDGDGEYLAVVQISDQRPVSAFAPYFPSVGKGESFGFFQGSHTRESKWQTLAPCRRHGKR